MYHALIVDDCYEQCISLQQIIIDYNQNITTSIATDISSAQQLCQQEKYDFFFLDIRMDSDKIDDDGGLQLAMFIRSIAPYKYTPIIFITSVPEKVQEALSFTGCYQYILKPYTEKDIFMCLDSVLHSPLVPPNYFSFHSFWGGEIRILEDDILFFTPSVHHRLLICTLEGNYETKDYTLDQLEEKLHHNFFRCHRKYIVNLQKISSYDKTKRTLFVENQTLSLGRNYKQKFDVLWRLMH